MTQYFIDTNIFLRFLLKDNEQQYVLAQKLFEKAENGELKLWTTNVVILEIVWTLKSFYKYPNKNIQKVLHDLFSLTNLSIENKKLLIAALDNFANKNVDLADAYNYELAKAANKKILSFDEDFKKLGSKEDINKIL